MEETSANVFEHKNIGKSFEREQKKGDETICSVLKEWLRVTTVGAIIAFTHKVTLISEKNWMLCLLFVWYSLFTEYNKIQSLQTLVLDTWEKEQKKLEDQELWKLVYRYDRWRINS